MKFIGRAEGLNYRDLMHIRRHIVMYTNRMSGSSLFYYGAEEARSKDFQWCIYEKR